MASSRHPLFAEFLVIVVGVLVALGVDATWEARGEREREGLFLQQLRDELRVSAEELSAAVEAERRLATSADSLAMAINGVRESSEGDRRRWLEAITGPSLFQPAAGTLNAVIATGDLRLVDEPDLRVSVLQYLNAIEKFSGLYSDFYSIAIESYGRLGDHVNLITQLQSSTEPVDWGALRENPVVTSAIVTTRITAVGRYLLLEDLQEAHSALLEALEAAEL